MVGRTLGRYKLVEEIGQGGMAVVYRGLDTTLQREVAVKILHPHLSRKEANRVRFAREARVVATLHHDNIVEIYDFSGGTEGDAFIVCEYIRGRTLADFVEKSPPIPVEVAVLMIAEIGHALAHAHAQGIIHRDIKPENVMIRQDGVLKLMDFGIARVQEDTGSTMTGALIGSPAYMSPEQVGGHPVDIRSDLFSAAVLLYRLVTGRLPFDAPTPAAVLRAVETVEPDAPHRLNPLVSRALDGVLVRALSKDPDKRQANIDLLVIDALASIADAQLAAPREELKAYFADPAAYAAKLTASLIPRYAKAGHDRRKVGDTAAAMEVWSRVLEMDPTNEDVKQALENLSRGRDRKKLLRMGLAGAAAFALAGTAGAAAWNAWPLTPSVVATPTPIADVSPTNTPLGTPAVTPAASPAGTGIRTPSPVKTAAAVASAVASPTATRVAMMIPTPTPIPADRALFELDILEVAKVSIGHPPGITIGDTFEARRGILVKPDDLQKILKQCDGWCRVTVTADPENKAFAGCQTLVAYAKLSDDRRFVLWNEGGIRRLAGEDLYLRGCQTLFRVDVPGLDAETYDKSTVKLDGTPTPLGAVGQTLSTTSGVHEISVKAPGFRPWKQKIEIRTKNRDDDPFVVKATLEAEP